MDRKNPIVRPARETDVPLILSFIRKKADFDRSTDAFHGTLQVSEESLRETMFGAETFARVIFAEVNGQAEGFALFYFRYSSFKGRPSLWLDDLYVNQTARREGVGYALMRAIARVAQAHCCTHLGWTASPNNHNGMRFYERLGAKIIDQRGGSLFYEAGHDVIHRLAGEVEPAAAVTA
jgi:GNAT superfamily N-acetyltransferase